MDSNAWGSKEWNEAHFPSAQLDKDGETWGFRWRGMEKMRHSTYLASLKKILQKEEVQKILDIGCALCDFTQRAWILNKNNQFYGMDISENAINWSKRSFPMFEIKVGALPEIPFDEQFDVVFCMEVLCYLDSAGRKETMTNISNSLAKSGILMFSGVLDGGKTHHTEEEVLGLINAEFEIDVIFYNYWKIYRSLIQYPLDNMMERLDIVKKHINLTDTEFNNLMLNSRSAKRLTLKSLRLVNPLSTFLLTGATRILKLILSSKILALIFSQISKVLLGKNKADEIVVIATKKES